MIYSSLILVGLSTLAECFEPRFLGRVNPATKELTWPSSGISFDFTGSSATINLASISGSNSFDLTVDGGQPIVLTDPDLAKNYISTPSGLPYGHHTVSLRKRSETATGTLSIGDITSNGKLQSNHAKSRRIEIIGDSISVGYGLDGTFPCTNTAALDDNPKTYGALAADALNADYSTVAWSGKGLIRNIATGEEDDSPLIPELYTRYGANDADGSYPFPKASTPDVVVIALGTNDFSYLGLRAPIDSAAFTDGMVKFVRYLDGHYPRADFFLLSSPMLNDNYPTTADAQHTTQTNAIKAAIAKLNCPRIHFLDWPSQGSDVGCDYHPNAATHAAQGKVLASAIAAVRHW